ncbi:hypothetical protein HYALB_00010889 [Hymenoscyphus albidus]|uniref:FAD-binding PCMH-type domain-containing protein n=1 Tax=Hymenoscyphus albidus TaxID=595503 RepID=A0A9N9Q7B9_9HELO|nr:hypothetical protein HYALB_00010889 [Hymenoscyphus albidus]
MYLVFWSFFALICVVLDFVQAIPSCDDACLFDTILRPRLSTNASIVHSSSAAPRWSEFNPPQTGTVVNVATEHDVLLTVQYCIAADIPFFAQSGGVGWANTFSLGKTGTTINLRGLNEVTFNEKRTEVTVQEGTIIEEFINAAYQNHARVATGNCNCVGVMGAALGAGVRRLMGLYGLTIDNLISMNIVAADGKAKVVTPENDPDL